MQSFLDKNGCNLIHFWYCPNKLEWPKHTLVDNEAKASHIPFTFPEKNLFLFSKKKECNLILESWQKLFKDSRKKE